MNVRIIYVFLSKIKIPGGAKNRAKHGLRGFMPRNIVTPYECRRHEVRGADIPRHRRLKDAKGCKIPSSRRLRRVGDDTPHFATRYARRLVRGYLFALLTELATRASHAFYMSFCLKKPPRRRYIFPPLLVEIGEVSPCDGGVQNPMRVFCFLCSYVQNKNTRRVLCLLCSYV